MTIFDDPGIYAPMDEGPDIIDPTQKYKDRITELEKALRALAEGATNARNRSWVDVATVRLFVDALDEAHDLLNKTTTTKG